MPEFACLYNQEITVHTPNSPLKKCIEHTDEIVLPYDQSNISFDVALLSRVSSSTFPKNVVSNALVIVNITL